MHSIKEHVNTTYLPVNFVNFLSLISLPLAQISQSVANYSSSLEH